MKFRFRSVAQNALFVVVSIALGLAVGEGVVRMFPGLLSEEALLRLHFSVLRGREPTTRRDPYLGFVNRAHYRGEVRGIGVAFTYSTDENGFRNRSPWPAQADIVVVGDSLSFGWGVADDETWSSLVSARLSRSRLINLALSGAAPQQYARIYERFGQPLKPKLVIFGLFPGNDVTDARRFDDWLRGGAPGNYNVWRFFGGEVPRSQTTLAERSYLLALVRQVAASRGARDGGLTIACSHDQRLQLVPAFQSRSARRATPGHPDFELVMQAVEEAWRHARALDARFLVLLFPTKEEVYLPVGAARLPSLIGPFAAELQKRGIPYLDLTPPLRSGAQTGQCLFFEIDGHPNAKGYQLIANAVLQHLRDKAPIYGLTDWN